MSHGLNIHDGTGMIAKDPTRGILIAYGTTVPTGRGYAPGCKFIKVNSTTLATLEYINAGTFASASFVAIGTAAAVVATCLYGEATALDAGFFVASRAYQVQSVIARPLVAGTDPSAVTGQIRKAASGTAAASGTVVHSGTIDLKGTINTNQTITLSTTAADILLAAGDALALDVTGTTAAARGIVSVLLLPV
jgi:hypothetical protein